MSQLIDAISIIGSVVGVYGVASSLFEGAPTHGTSVTVHVSDGRKNDGGATLRHDTGGRIRSIYSYGNAGNLLGSSKYDQHINAGDKHTFKIDQGNQQQAGYIDIVASDDAVCIPLVTVTEPGNGLDHAWVGDVFKACGLENYYGDVDVTGDGKFPNCGWIDANHQRIENTDQTVGQGSFKWQLSSFSRASGDDNYNRDAEFYCHPRAFEVRYDAQPIEKRSGEERRARLFKNAPDNKIITSPHAAHPASALCEDPTTVGADFVSLFENTFCDMGTKQWYPLCDRDIGISNDCVDFDMANGTISHQSTGPQALGIANIDRSYDFVTNW